MIIPGRIRNGVVVLEGGPPLPEGAAVSVTYPAAPTPSPVGEKKRVEFPLVRGGEPCSLHLTNEQIGEILDEEDSSLIRRYFAGGDSQQHGETLDGDDVPPRR